MNLAGRGQNVGLFVLSISRDDDIDPLHLESAAKARLLYLDGLSVEQSRADWRFAVRDARRLAAAALRSSRLLTDIAGALEQNGGHALVFRQVLAPPVSQDQFKLICPSYSKAVENSGRSFPPASARAIAAAITRRLDSGVVAWGHRGAKPNRREVETFLRVASTLIGLQRLGTARRKRLSFEQEYAVTSMLDANGWVKLPSKLIDTRAAVPLRHYMQKTRFATATIAPQEVDIACGLKNSYVLAMECKVTNDETNSIKRINDILKKATAWKQHWGSFVVTAALLQGVISAKDVQRLADAGVHVFWSHDMSTFKSWLDEQII